MKGWMVCLALLAVGAMLGGCEAKKEYGDKKEDWAKSAPPPQYRGPGQPGGPPSGALSGPASAPPASVMGPGAQGGQTGR